jgi:Skp family chaperone for outer membrane proteins
MKRVKAAWALAVIFLEFVMAAPVPGFSQSRTLTRIGYVDIDRIMETYIDRFFTSEIEWRERYLSEIKVPSMVFTGQAREEELERWLQEHSRSLDYLKSNQEHWKRSGEVRDQKLLEQLHADIIQSVRKTAVMEGFSIIISNTGNFVYGTVEVDLTGKVLFRLDSQLLERQRTDPPLLWGGDAEWVTGDHNAYRNRHWYRYEDSDEYADD